jgi:hypothetical protein
MFKHICTTFSFGNWESIKDKYKQTQYQDIDDFTPIFIEGRDLLNKGAYLDLVRVLREGRKSKEIAVVYFESKRALNNLISQLDKDIKLTIELNCHIIKS